MQCLGYPVADILGRELIREMLERSSGEIIHPWRYTELGETLAWKKLVVFDTLLDSQMALAGGTYIEEFRRLPSEVTRCFVVGGLILALPLAAFLYLLIARLIVGSLQQKVMPVLGDFLKIGQRIGKVGEWVDRTAKLNAQRSVKFSDRRRQSIRRPGILHPATRNCRDGQKSKSAASTEQRPARSNRCVQ